MIISNQPYVVFLMYADAADMKDDGSVHRQQLDAYAKELFLPFRCFCTRKDVGN